jgi:hypothetical protein
VPIHGHFGGLYVNLLGDVFADADFLSTAVTDLSFGRDVMRNFRTGKMLRYLTSAVPLLSLWFGSFLGRRGNSELRRR